ncbi:lysine exporter LysO family protein [Halothermothrix orenii]|nr:lysine exporter LysO family protein [Halothermothrix orenii]
MTGFILSYSGIFKEWVYNVIGKLSNISLFLLLLAMGTKMGANEDIISKLGVIGIKALILAMSGIIGSVIMVRFGAYKLSNNLEPVNDNNDSSEQAGYIFSLVILLTVVTGMLLGYLLIPTDYLVTMEKLTGFALKLLLFCIGFEIGNNKNVIRELKYHGWQLCIIPILVAIGSISGTVVAGFILNMPSHEAAGVGAGFGWYSLSGVLITKIHSIELGSLAFITNIFRELLSIILLPFVVRLCGRMSSLAPGGATTMDVTLPFIKKTAGEIFVIPAFVNGLILSLLVPLLVPLFL